MKLCDYEELSYTHILLQGFLIEDHDGNNLSFRFSEVDISVPKVSWINWIVFIVNIFFPLIL